MLQELPTEFHEISTHILVTDIGLYAPRQTDWQVDVVSKWSLFFLLREACLKTQTFGTKREKYLAPYNTGFW